MAPFFWQNLLLIFFYIVFGKHFQNALNKKSLMSLWEKNSHTLKMFLQLWSRFHLSMIWRSLSENKQDN